MSGQSNVYCHNIPLEWDTADIERMFSQYGKIVSTRVLKNPHNMNSRGICFVRFESYEEAANAIENINGTLLPGGVAPALAKFARDPAEGNKASNLTGHEDLCNLYIQNVPLHWTQDDIKRTFEVHGPVQSAFVLMDRNTGQSRGIGFCRFENAQSASNAISKLNGVVLEGMKVPFSVSVAKEKKQQKFNQFQQQSYGTGATDYNYAALAQQNAYSQYGYAAAYQQQAAYANYAQQQAQQPPTGYGHMMGAANTHQQAGQQYGAPTDMNNTAGQQAWQQQSMFNYPNHA